MTFCKDSGYTLCWTHVMLKCAEKKDIEWLYSLFYDREEATLFVAVEWLKTNTTMTISSDKTVHRVFVAGGNEQLWQELKQTEPFRNVDIIPDVLIQTNRK